MGGGQEEEEEKKEKKKEKESDVNSEKVYPPATSRISGLIIINICSSTLEP